LCDEQQLHGGPQSVQPDISGFDRRSYEKPKLVWRKIKKWLNIIFNLPCLITMCNN
jgi:hypothetical protein